MDNDNYNRLKKLALDSGACLFGVCNLRTVDGKIFNLSKEATDNLNCGISVAIHLSDRIINDIKDRPTKLYFYHYRQANYLLDRLAFKMMDWIQKERYQALPIPASQTIEWKEQKGHLSHKAIAVGAGLGWLGRNNLLVHPLYGSRIRLVTVLTDMPLPCDKPMEGGCGNCRECITVCPAGAIKEEKERFDSIACFRQLDNFRKECNIGHHICGICVKACKGKNVNGGKQ